MFQQAGWIQEGISIHVPREGDDFLAPKKLHLEERFLSTSPVRGTTLTVLAVPAVANYFYPRPP